MSSHCWNHPGEFDGIRIAAKRDQCAAVDVDRRGWGRGLAVDRADHGKFAALCRGDRRQLIVHQIIAAGTGMRDGRNERIDDREPILGRLGGERFGQSLAPEVLTVFRTIIGYEIGRASCRARVWWYVLLEGVGGPLK